MATGDSDDFIRRIRGLIPAGWTRLRALTGGVVDQVATAIFGGLADSLAWAYGQLQGASAATRRAGLTGWLLDLDAFGFFGDAFLRMPSESDDAWRERYTDEVFRTRGTRAAITQALIDLTGRAPIIVEPWNPGDCGGWDTPYFAWSGAQVSPGPIGAYDSPYAGWGVGSWGWGAQAALSLPGSTGAGCWGSLIMPAQMFITAYRTDPVGTPYAAGWDTPYGGWGAGNLSWVGDNDDVIAPDEEIYATINRNKVAGVIAWTNIQS